MGKKLPHTMVLVAAALIACAFISGYNAFYVPQTNLPRVIYTEKGTRPEGTGPSVPPHAAPSGAEQEPTRGASAFKGKHKYRRSPRSCRKGSTALERSSPRESSLTGKNTGLSAVLRKSGMSRESGKRPLKT